MPPLAANLSAAAWASILLAGEPAADLRVFRQGPRDTASALICNWRIRFTTFLDATHRMWIAAIVGIVSLVLMTLLSGLRVHKLNVTAANSCWGWTSVAVLIASGMLAVAGWGAHSFAGPLVLTMSLSVLVLCALVVREK